MKALIDAQVFKQIYNNSKHFISKTAPNPMMQYIKLCIHADTDSIQAFSCNPYALSVENGCIQAADESFEVYIKPPIPVIPKSIKYIKLERKENKAFITIGDIIVGYVQPENEYFNVDSVLNAVKEQKPVAVISLNADILAKACQSVKTGNSQKNQIILEITDSKHAVKIRSNLYGDTENQKIIMPIKLK